MKTLQRIMYEGERVISRIRILMYPEIERWFLEYDVDAEYRNKGIMSRELPLFLQDCKTRGFNQIAAMVQERNIASRKILEKNNFVNLYNFEGVCTYIIDLMVNKEKSLEMLKMFKELRSDLQHNISQT